jgi:two-component system response regulator AtoC
MLFEDPLSHAPVLQALNNAVAPPDSSQAVVSSRSATVGIHEEPVHKSVQADQQPTHPPYDEEFLRRVGRSNVPVLLNGETGVGKEVMARKLWTYSNRVAKPFLKLNCAALPSELIESELFGYEKGAFTGALVDKPGKFELAQDGTILLDEIGDMDTRLQAKLLQVLQDGEVQPLGSSRTIKVNVRIMAATHRDLRAAIEQGTFREDLYYRLNVVSITIPPLRERRDEIIPLAEELLLRHVAPGSSVPSIPETLRQAMLDHNWPGNVRELENVMRRFLVYQDAALLAAELSRPFDLPKRRPAAVRVSTPDPAPLNETRGSFDHFAEASRVAEARLLLETLESVRWNRRQAAMQLNIDYKALLYKLQKHGIVESKSKRREVSA